MKRRKVRWARSARRDLEAIVGYLADRSPRAAFAALAQLEQGRKGLTT